MVQDMCNGCDYNSKHEKLKRDRDALLEACHHVSRRFSAIASKGGSIKDFLNAGSFGEIMAAISQAESEV